MDNLGKQFEAQNSRHIDFVNKNSLRERSKKSVLKSPRKEAFNACPVCLSEGDQVITSLHMQDVTAVFT